MFATPFALMFALATVSVPVTKAPTVTSGTRAAAALTRMLEAPVMKGLDVGAAVRCTADDSLWGTTNPDALLNPASGTKLLTTAAASEVIALDVRWPTTVHGRLVSGRVDGDLVLVGNGDPWLQLADLDRLATAVHKAGVKTIAGDIVADVSRFEGPMLPPAFDQKNTDAAYRPAVTALGVTFGAVMIGVKPGKKVGDPVRVIPTPNVDAIVVEVGAKTVEGKATKDLVIESRAGKEGKTRILVSGTLGRNAPNQAVKKRVEDPALIAADVFRVYLQKRGVKLEGKVRIAREPVATKGAELARIESRSVAEIIHEINTFSNNFMAESLFAHLGEDGSERGSWQRGQAAVASALDALDVPDGSYRVVNGSGLYDATHISARGMVALLDAMAAKNDAWWTTFHDSLAISGKSGTLRSRMKKLAGQVYAKTGTLDEAVSLSGYVPAKSGCLLAFSLLVNGPIGDKAGRVQAALDALVTDIAEL